MEIRTRFSSVYNRPNVDTWFKQSRTIQHGLHPRMSNDKLGLAPRVLGELSLNIESAV